MRQLTWVGVVAATCVAVSYIANAEPKKEKLVPLPAVLRSLETNQAITLVNPKEVTVDKAVSWTKSKNSKDDSPELEFTDSEPKTLACELLFDMFEERGNVYNTFVQPIEFQTKVDPALGRPPLMEFTFGNFPKFRGVIEDMNVKYTLFLPDGTPTRATLNLKMKEASKLTAKQSSDNPNTCISDQDCPGGRCADSQCVPNP